MRPPAPDRRPLIGLVGEALAGEFRWTESFDWDGVQVHVYKRGRSWDRLMVGEDGQVFEMHPSGAIEAVDAEDALEDLFGPWKDAA